MKWSFPKLIRDYKQRQILNPSFLTAHQSESYSRLTVTQLKILVGGRIRPNEIVLANRGLLPLLNSWATLGGSKCVPNYGFDEIWNQSIEIDQVPLLPENMLLTGMSSILLGSWGQDHLLALKHWYFWNGEIPFEMVKYRYRIRLNTHPYRILVPNGTSFFSLHFFSHYPYIYIIIYYSSFQSCFFFCQMITSLIVNLLCLLFLIKF